MTTETDIERAAEHTLARIDLADLPTDYGYHSLPLCLIDAVYSINAHYNGVLNVVRRYCVHAGITEDWPAGHSQRPVPREAQHPISVLLAHMRATGPEAFTHTVFQNLQRTSTRSGILKGEAVYQFAQALERRRIEHIQDLPPDLDGTSLDEAIRRIPGQNSGVGLRYFQMLAGGDDFIKPDRMIFRFLADALGRPVSPSEAQGILTAVSARLKPAVPALTPRLLDNRIWQYQRIRAI